MNIHTAQPSIQRHLITTLMGITLLVWLTTLAMIQHAAEQQVEYAFDAELQHVAETLQALLEHEFHEQATHLPAQLLPQVQLPLNGLSRLTHISAVLQKLHQQRHKNLENRSSEKTDTNTEHDLILGVKFRDGQALSLGQIPDTWLQAAEGFGYLSDPHGEWRIYKLLNPEFGFHILMGERSVFREHSISAIANRTLLPALLVMPLLSLLIWLAIRRGLQPLQRVATAVANRPLESQQQLDSTTAPIEIRPLVDALNRLFERMQTAIERERRFTADAAHELRTPIAAIKTHLQVAQGYQPDELIAEAIDQAIEGTERVTHTAEQLLVMARADAGLTRPHLDIPIDLPELIQQVAANLSQFALQREIELEIEINDHTIVSGEPELVKILIRNLLDNAIRYNYTGGRVKLSVQQHHASTCLSVADNGPGIEQQHRQHLGERFYRGNPKKHQAPGSGLGLAIVDGIIKMHHAEQHFTTGLDGQGLSVTVRFPSSPCV